MLVPGCLCAHYLEGKKEGSTVKCRNEGEGGIFFKKSIFERPVKNTNPSTASGMNMKKSVWNCADSVLMGCLS